MTTDAEVYFRAGSVLDASVHPAWLTSLGETANFIQAGLLVPGSYTRTKQEPGAPAIGGKQSGRGREWCKGQRGKNQGTAAILRR
jgi:hypothetical protein